MQGTLIVEFGWCGFGRTPGEMPGLCCGPFRVRWMRGGIEAKFRVWADAMKAAAVKVAR